MPESVNHIKELLAAHGAPSSDYDLNPEIKLPADRKLRQAAVLVPIIEQHGALHVILTMRSSALKHHPGQIAFPGGKLDESDMSLEDTALREANEEIGLPRDVVNVLGQLPTHETVTGFIVGAAKNGITIPFHMAPTIFGAPLRGCSKCSATPWRGHEG